MKQLDSARLKSLREAKQLTQTSLAAAAGISRVQVARILASQNPRVRNATAERLARALDVAVSAIELGGRGGGDYLHWVARGLSHLDFRGLGLPGLPRQPIDEVFVDLDVVAQGCGAAEDGCIVPGKTIEASGGLQQPLSATECLRRHDRILLLGEPGSGKTTLLRYVAWQAAAGTAGHETPIYVRLPEFCRARQLDGRMDLLAFVSARAAQDGCLHVEGTLRQELENRQRHCLVLLDGLDEVGSAEQRRLLAESVRAFIELYPCNRFVATSRPAGFEPAEWRTLGFSFFRIAGYTESRLQVSAEKWADVLASWQNRRRAEVHASLQSAIFSNPRVRALASNPLMLTILVLIHEARGGALPRRRVDLYEKVADVFLETWESTKRWPGTGEEISSIELDGREFRWLLAELALAMQKAGLTLAPRWWFIDHMQEFLQQRLGFEPDSAKDACDRILRYLAERTGLIEERGPDLFGFTHRTLQEYFASLGVRDEAEASLSHDPAAVLAGAYYHPQWSEVIRLLAAQLTPAPAESLLARILDDPDPLGRFLHRGPLLALGCLADGATIANRRLVSQAFDSLADLGRTRWLGITLDAIDLLEDCEGTRWSDRARQTLTAIMQSAKEQLSEAEYACLHSRVHRREMVKAVADELPTGLVSEAAGWRRVEIDGLRHAVVCVNAALLRENPPAWYASACVLLDSAHEDEVLKAALIGEMGRRVATDRRAELCLRKLLSRNESPEVRAACAAALKAVANGKRPFARRALLRAIQRNDDPQVRGACAAALRDVARSDSEVRRQLLDLLLGDEAADLRKGAARGLAGATSSDRSVCGALLQVASQEAAPEPVRAACAWALAPKIGERVEATEALVAWLADARFLLLQRVSAQALAQAMAAERLDWDHGLVEKIEGVLMGLSDPCPHALDSLEALAEAREVRHGLRVESVLRDALRPLGDRIAVAFVFGSTARNRQHADSDIDLFILGDVSLRALSAPLRQAENTLGRRINPVIHTRDAFRTKLSSGDPFVLDVVRREKIPLLISSRSASKEELDDELRGMVPAEPMAAAK